MDSFCKTVFTFCMFGDSFECLRRFSDVGSAQRCIEGLRKYRNLHPSFSKVGKIPMPRHLFNIHRSKYIASLARNTLNTTLSSRPTRTRIVSSHAWRNSRILRRLISTSKGESFPFRRVKGSEFIPRLPLSIDEEVSFDITTESDKFR